MQRPVASSLDEPRNLNEPMAAISSTQDGKAPGRDGIPAELLFECDLWFVACNFKKPKFPLIDINCTI